MSDFANSPLTSAINKYTPCLLFFASNLFLPENVKYNASRPPPSSYFQICIITGNFFLVSINFFFSSINFFNFFPFPTKV